MRTYTIAWEEVQGRGRLVARNDANEVIRQESCDQPIVADSDSQAIAERLFGDVLIVSVDHDQESVHVNVDWS